MTNVLSNLQPNDVWNWFFKITQIPRETFKEQKIMMFLVDFAKDRGLEYKQDIAGNLLIIKPKQNGGSNNTVCLQAHSDMVCTKEKSSDFNFDTDPIDLILQGDVLKANKTTLGADNGIGLAAILAILDSKTIIHCNIEALITVSEEVGLTGACNLNLPIKSTYLINLDSESDDVITIGSAGSVELDLSWNNVEYVKLDNMNDFKCYSLEVDNLSGGHSGVDINKNRANAIKIIIRMLFTLRKKYSIEIISIECENARNVIPRNANAKILIPNEYINNVEQEIGMLHGEIKWEFQHSEKNLTINFSPSQSNHNMVLSHSHGDKILHGIYSVINGVYKLNQSTSMVETSSNLASIKLMHCNNGDILLIKALLRSSSVSSLEDVKNMFMASFFHFSGIKVMESGYNPWQPNYSSFLTSLAKNIYEDCFGESPKIEDVHAGLECSMIDKNNIMDKISIGPNIANPHSPQESVSIKSVDKFYGFLLRFLKVL